MLTTEKQSAAREKPQRQSRYDDPPSKMTRALRALERRYYSDRERRRREQDYQPLTCNVKIDRLVITVREPLTEEEWHALRNIPGYGAPKDHRLHDQAYGRAIRIRGTSSIKEYVIQHERKAHFLARYRITIVAVDAVGLKYDDLCRILELLPRYTIVLVEVAFDFPVAAIVDDLYVQQFALFGRSRPRAVGNIPLWDCWGTRTSAKFVRSYLKAEINKYRIELELHARFLRQNKIDDVFDFPRLSKIISRHIFFGELDAKKVVAALSWRSPKDQRRVLAELNGKGLSEALRYLRRTIGLKNTRRLVLPLATNDVVRKAVEQWASQWPSARNELTSVSNFAKDARTLRRR